MKMITIAAIALTATSASALEVSLDNNLIRSNVPAVSGSVPGFLVVGEGYFVEHAYADRVSVEATVLPAGLDSKDLDEVMAYLASIGSDAQPALRLDDREITRETFTVQVEVSPGVFEDQERGRLVEDTSRATNGGW